jgi:SAM-dependent methyltransferase
MATNDYGGSSLWRDTAGLDDARAGDRVAALEKRAQAADEVAAREEYLTLMQLAPGERVLDVGCGSGVVTREMARRVAPRGRVVGCDTSAAILALASKLAATAGVPDLIEWRQADCRALPFASDEFDAVLASTVLGHVPEAERAIREMVRVTRPGGRVGVFDFDADSFVIAHPDRALTRRVVAAMSDHAAVDSWLARRLPGILTDLGLVDVRARGFMPLEREAGTFYAGMAERAANLAAETHAITTDERDRWLAGLHGEIAAGRFVGGRLHIFTWGRRVAEPRCASAPAGSPNHAVRGGERSATPAPP